MYGEHTEVAVMLCMRFVRRHLIEKAVRLRVWPMDKAGNRGGIGMRKRCVDKSDIGSDDVATHIVYTYRQATCAHAMSNISIGMTAL